MDIGDGIASRFATGQRIALRVNRSRTGVVVGVLASRGSASRYRVFHGPDEREYDEDQLVADEADKGDALLDALAEGRFVLPREFRARLTAAQFLYPTHRSRLIAPRSSWAVTRVRKTDGRLRSGCARARGGDRAEATERLDRPLLCGWPTPACVRVGSAPLALRPRSPRRRRTARRRRLRIPR